MTEENSTTPQEKQYFELEKNWNEELRDWYKKGERSMEQISRETGIPRPTLRDYIAGAITDLDRVSGERRMQLYNLTGLEFFKVEEGYEKKPNLVPGRKKKRSKIVIENKNTRKKESIIIQNNLTGIQKLEAGLLKCQEYKPSYEKRADAVMELLDVLAEEIDYYRSASSNERSVLVDRLKKDPESFSYVTQILNVIYQGKQMDAWMMMIEAPSKIKRIRRERQ
ncbi:Uncharacterised protein [uncultured archaeon]|nr:Uncharacterised protein [uncultured archaeon]